MLTTIHVLPQQQQQQQGTGYVPVKAATKGLLPENRWLSKGLASEQVANLVLQI